MNDAAGVPLDLPPPPPPPPDDAHHAVVDWQHDELSLDKPIVMFPMRERPLPPLRVAETGQDD
jgi:hypothetical protein